MNKKAVLPRSFRVVAPGRVNLIGDHTDYMGGLAFPMAINLATTITGIRSGPKIELHSDQIPGELQISLPVTEPQLVRPSWGRYVAGVAAELGSTEGFVGRVSSTLPHGSGLSSSAALEVATALALGDTGPPLEVALRCQAAEQAATGVPCGIMDQLAIISAQAGHGMLIDFASQSVTALPIPEAAQFWVIHSGEGRQLVGSPYVERRVQAESAAAVLGPLPQADLSSINALSDQALRHRARHVQTECTRVTEFAAALLHSDLEQCGELMLESHASLRDDYEVSTDALNSLVEKLRTTSGVYGARLTGAGFGGCVVALADPEVTLEGWRVMPSNGARMEWLEA
ncbi:MAG: galactokinase family protein [Actinomycetes bacterium]